MEPEAETVLPQRPGGQQTRDITEGSRGRKQGSETMVRMLLEAVCSSWTVTWELQGRQG